MVHGVGGHDHLSNLLRTYQSFRANLTSVEVPVLGEDQIPGWRLSDFDEGADPPTLRLEPILPTPDGGVGAVVMYEVNYSGFAGVVRRNQPIDLTGLFLGLDLAICAARHRPRDARDPVFGADTTAIAASLQRVAAVFCAGTVPIIGLPALLFRSYIGTFIALFTRFFEDIATFVLDKNGEQLISAHLDRTIATIARDIKDGDRLVIAAHSLGSVVVHNYVIRQWRNDDARTPHTVLTFGSPIGLLIWVWLFLDFENMDFRRPIDTDRYFCWNPVSTGTGTRPTVSWINVVNSVDPIATAFPLEALDLSTPVATVAAALEGGTIEHRFFGPARVGRVGAAHAQYLNDKKGFLEILLRASGLASGRPEEVSNGPASGKPQDVARARSAVEHWTATARTLFRLQWLLFVLAVAAITGYITVVTPRIDDDRKYVVAVLYLWPALTIGILAFFQRLSNGRPTKRINSELILDLPNDRVSVPYRIRERVRRWLGGAADIDPMAPSPSYPARLLANALSFLPTLAAMAVPFIWTMRVSHHSSWLSSWSEVFSARALGALGLFMVYVIACAAFELVRHWRQLVRLLGHNPAPTPEA